MKCTQRTLWICLDETGPVFCWQGQWVANPLATSLQDRLLVVDVEKLDTNFMKVNSVVQTLSEESVTRTYYFMKMKSGW